MEKCAQVSFLLHLTLHKKFPIHFFEKTLNETIGNGTKLLNETFL